MIDEIVKQDCLNEDYITKTLEKELQHALYQERLYLQGTLLLTEATDLLNDPLCSLSEEQKSRLEHYVSNKLSIPFTKSNENIIQKIEQQIQSKYEKVAQYIITSNPDFIDDNNNNNNNNGDDIITKVKQKQEWIKKTQLLVAQRKLKINKKMSDYVNIVLDILGVTWHVMQEFKYKISNKDQSFDSYYGTLADTLLLKIKTLHVTVLLGTYDKEFMYALGSIRDLLESRFNEARKSLQEASRELKEYEEIGPEFQTISKAYNDLLYKIESTKQDIARIYQD